MITFTELIIGTGGIAPCLQCAKKGAAVSPSPVDIAQMELTARRPANPGISGVALVGFEPFAHPQLPAIIASVRAQGEERIRLRTDCGALVTPGNAEGVIAAGVRHLEAVFLSDAANHDRLTGRAGLFEAATRGVRIFTAAAAAADARCVLTGYIPLCPHNVQTAAFAVAHLASLGAVAVHVDAAQAKQRDEAHVIAALDTGAALGVAAFVTGWPSPVDRPYDRLPWLVEGALS